MTLVQPREKVNQMAHHFAVSYFEGDSRPTLFETVNHTLRLNDDPSVVLLLSITFGLVIIPAFIVYYSRRQ